MATTYDKASLVMIPSGVKEDKLYSIKPTDGSGDFTFSRNADIEATRVNSSGLIEKAKVNLLSYSNTFDNYSVWALNESDATSGETGYDGSTDAWRLTANGISPYINQGNFSGLRTISIYVKAGTYNQVSLINGGYGQGVQFDLTSGTIVTNSNASIYYPVITSISVDWYRISLFIAPSAPTYGLLVAPQLLNGGGIAVGEYIYIQDAQINHGLVAQDYVETTTTAVVEGLTADLPRLDYHNPDSPTPNSCPSLLIEPSRTNAVLFSEYFEGTGWTNNKATLETNTTETLSPEGVYNATLRTNDTTTGYHDLNVALGTYSQGTITASVFAKKKGSDFLQINLHTSASNWSAVKFNLATGEVAHEAVSGSYTTSGSIEAFADGWYRCTITSTNSASSAAIYSPIAVPLDGSAPSGDFGFDGGYTGSTSQSIYIYGYQAELNQSYGTSYIPTYGTAANRGGEVYSKSGATSIIGQTQGSVFLEITQNGLPNYTQRVLTISDGTTNNIIGFQLAANNSITFYLIDGGVASAIITKNSATTEGQKVKIAAAYAENDFVLYIDGVQVGTDSSGSIPSTSVITNNRPTGGTPFVGEVHQTLLFKTRLTNAELAALTA